MQLRNLILVSCIFASLTFAGLSQDVPDISTNTSNHYHVISVTNIHATLNDIIQLMQDTSRYTEWLHFCKSAKLIEEINSTQWLFEFIYDADNNLLKDRYIKAMVEITKNPTNDTLLYKITKPSENFENIDDISPGLKAIHDFNIEWEFIQENDLLQIKYDVFIDPRLPRIFDKRIEKYLKELSRQTLANLFSETITES